MKNSVHKVSSLDLNSHDDGVDGLSEQLDPGHPLLVADGTAPFLSRACLQHICSYFCNVFVVVFCFCILGFSGAYLDVLLFHTFLCNGERREALTPEDG